MIENVFLDSITRSAGYYRRCCTRSVKQKQKKTNLFGSKWNLNDDVLGKGRGRQVIAVARTADMVLMMLDATKGDKQR